MSALPTAELLPQLHTLGKRLYVLSNYGPVGFAVQKNALPMCLVSSTG